MLHKKTALLRAAAPVAVLALAVTACGGHKKTASATDDAPRTEKVPKAEKESSPPADSGELKPGQGGTGKFKEENGTITYEVAAQKLQVSTEAETRKLVSDPKRAKGLVAATAWVKYTHKGGGVVKQSPDVADESEIYADGQRGGLLIGAAEDGRGCEDTFDIENWKAGQSHTICQTYMIPKGAKSLEVHWAGEGRSGSPLIWKFDDAG
ncbi:hypothetical protein [Streptomyces tubercidicus]|uniref:Lipoprotein n=1 Tax=Streptomyces tubercidicus TaxID=47759 RepID=A0A640UP90_9ACTN|nr:hypothetical protein [Streptomyces tubercidicus]WAU12406.1 hypothetical protein STRTU_002746 [Streptomyces tubercidicus]GFE37833.1 lipoprotein [Streptomyces tubercidicus]